LAYYSNQIKYNENIWYSPNRKKTQEQTLASAVAVVSYATDQD